MTVNVSWGPPPTLLNQVPANPLQGQRKGIVMRRVLIAAAAAAAIGITSPAYAAVTLDTYNGPDLATMIKASKVNTTNDNPQVVGSTDNAGNSANVLFTGLKADKSTGTIIHITDGAGFASITDEVDPEDLYGLIVQITDNTFTQFMFSVQLINDGNVTIYYQMGGSWFEATPNGGYFQKANGNNTYLLQGGVFTAVMVYATSPIKEYKQNSVTLGTVAVPEPATWALMLLGFGGMGLALRRGRRRSKPALMQIA